MAADVYPWPRHVDCAFGKLVTELRTKRRGASKETELEQAFNRAFLVELLGYELYLGSAGSWMAWPKPCLIHSTIRALKEQLDARFIQLHRSWLVRIDFIDRLIHEDRRWIARLCDGSQLPVAKSHVAEVLKLMTHDPHEMRAPAEAETFVEAPR